MHVFPDGSLVTTGRDGSLKHWRSVEGEHAWYCETLEEYILVSAMHASMDGRLAIGLVHGSVWVWDRTADGSFVSWGMCLRGEHVDDVQVLPDHRMVVSTQLLSRDMEGARIRILIPSIVRRNTYITEQSYQRAFDDEMGKFTKVRVREDGMIVIVENDFPIVTVLDGEPVT